ncbi:transglutaminase-like domain-containing protein [Methylomonas sp. AM2-LC]|uniref:transglutaminase-like domain-containing protein n=1 Tax=Methylomonas sp. AM2-LC TaxID=3153301 RepID=UPI003264012A
MLSRECFLKKRFNQFVISALFSFLSFSVNATQPTTDEIDFTSTAAQPLANEALQLAKQGNAVAIYEYAYNNFIFETYHGSRSGSANTFLGLHGSDVDIASTLIAMLRSQNIPARYATGTIQLSAAQLNNWFGVGNSNVAFQLMVDQGYQKLSYSTGGAYTALSGTQTSTGFAYYFPTSAVTSVQFEHVWVEALIPFDQYRGLPTPTTVDCSVAANASRCVWVPLDASFKQYSYNSYGLDPTSGTSPVTFDYNCYYNAYQTGYKCSSGANPVSFQNKNPLTILEGQITAWLQTNYPGKTLDDVANEGQLIQVHDGLLPASLPYPVIGKVRTYDSVDLHDAAAPPVCTSACAETKKWAKTLSINFNTTAVVTTTTSSTSYPISGTTQPVKVATLNTARLTMHVTTAASSNVPSITLYLGGQQILAPATGNIPGYTLNNGDLYSVTLNVDGVPDPLGGTNESNFSAAYNNLTYGGYYLLAIGGSYSNWSQVHNAADQLIADSATYKVVLNPKDAGTSNGACDFTIGLNCTPYVDTAGTGVYAATDPTLLNDPTALDALTGGLLYTASSQYLAYYRDYIDRANHLMKTAFEPVCLFGLVSSTYEAEYLNNTAFSVMPGGLVIDMKGQEFVGGFKVNASPTIANSQFLFQGHMMSALEHEIWQELTGYDAVSTVRGIQMALANTSGLGTSLLTVNSQSSVQSNYATFGFSSTLPSGFTADPFTIFSTKPYTWTNTKSPVSFDTLLGTVSSSNTSVQLETHTYTYDPTNGAYIYAWANCTNNLITSVKTVSSIPASAGATTCWGTPISGTQAAVLSEISTDWSNNIIPFLNYYITDQFTYFDQSQGFTTTNRLYRSYPPLVSQYSPSTVASIRNDFYIPPSNSSISYTMPSTTVVTPFNRFEVYIRSNINTSTGNYNSLDFVIGNLGL